MSEPWLSVVMTTYNACDYLTVALESVTSQEVADLEVIAVDDGSTDKTLEILERYRSRIDLKIIVIKHTGNWIANMNRGLKLARGRYVSFLHHDDYWMSGRIKAARALLDKVPETVLLVHPVWFVDARGQRLGLWRNSLGTRTPLSPEKVVERLLVQNSIAMPSPIFRREVALQVGCLDEDLWHSADWDFWLKLAAEGLTIDLPRPLAAYRIHPVTATWQGTSRMEDYRWQMDAVLDRHSSSCVCNDRTRSNVLKVARFSIEVNTRLAAYAHGYFTRLGNLMVLFAAIGPGGWRRYLRDSRIIERVSSRVRAGMLRWPRTPDGLVKTEFGPSKPHVAGSRQDA